MYLIAINSIKCDKLAESTKMENQTKENQISLLEKGDSMKPDVLKLDPYSHFLSKEQLPSDPGSDHKSRNGVLNQV